MKFWFYGCNTLILCYVAHTAVYILKQNSPFYINMNFSSSVNFGCFSHCAALHRIAQQCCAMECDAFWRIAAQCSAMRCNAPNFVWFTKIALKSIQIIGIQSFFFKIHSPMKRTIFRTKSKLSESVKFKTGLLRQQKLNCNDYCGALLRNAAQCGAMRWNSNFMTKNAFFQSKKANFNPQRLTQLDFYSK